MTELSVDDHGQQGNVDDGPLSGSYSIDGITWYYDISHSSFWRLASLCYPGSRDRILVRCYDSFWKGH